MKKKHVILEDVIVAIVIVISLCVFTTSIVLAYKAQVDDEAIYITTKTEVSEAKAEINEHPVTPAFLSIPIIGVETKIEHVGISKKGAIMPPSTFDRVGWYRYGKRPGESGNAYIVGHVDNAFGLSGVFKDAPQLAKGNSIYVIDSEGTMLQFKVTDTKIVAYNEPSLGAAVGETRVPRIVLITCHGEWLKERDTYSERLLVIAELSV